MPHRVPWNTQWNWPVQVQIWMDDVEQNHERMFFNQFSKKEIEEYREIFNFYKNEDRDSFHCERLKSVLASIGHYMSNDEIAKLILKIDQNRDGLIQFEEFVYMMNASDLSSNSMGFLDFIGGMCEEFSKQNMEMSKGEMVKMVLETDLYQTSTNIKEIKEEVDDLFLRMDKNNNNVLDLNQFASMLMYLANNTQ